MTKIIWIGLILLLLPALVQAQANVGSSASPTENTVPKVTAETSDRSEPTAAELLKEMREMRNLIQVLDAKVQVLEAQLHAARTESTSSVPPATIPAEDHKAAGDVNTVPLQTAAPKVRLAQEKAQTADDESVKYTKSDRNVIDFLRDTTINATFSGYYSYNFNRPVGRINLLRAYDVMANSFSINYVALVIERAPDVAAGRRFGARLDLQFGQATETLQGSAANELRPQVYRPVFQIYGTYVAPIGRGLTVDFGKWASALGYESNYTKDQINYSRSYFFNFLPFYHTGFRTNYAFNGKINVTHWLVNGTQQTEDFNNFKSQAVLVNIKPAKSVSWNLNYYGGREQRDLVAALNPTFPPLPTQPGLSTNVIRPVPRGRLHIFDTYASWNVTDKLLFVGEADYVINRVESFSPPARVTGGAIYARYQLTPKWALAGRGEYLSDRGGLFSGVTQALKETTFTADYKMAEGFIVRGEYRRDFSNQAFFLTSVPGQLKKEQTTTSLGLIWWFGRKAGSW